MVATRLALVLLLVTFLVARARSVRPSSMNTTTPSAAPLLIDGAAAHHVWDGLGALSAGASSRLLVDYPLPQRSDILDVLYGPTGAALSICKIEIGGDVMSTDGVSLRAHIYRVRFCTLMHII